MKWEIYNPGWPLNGYIDSIWYCRQPGQSSPEFERVLPTGTMELVIPLNRDSIRVYNQPGDFINHPYGVLSGLHTQPFVLDSAEHTEVLGVHFRAGGSFPFLDRPAKEVQNLSVSTADVWGQERAESFHDCISTLKTPSEIFRATEHFFNQLAKDRLGRHQGVSASLQKLMHAPYGQTIKELADVVNLSTRRLSTIFQNEVGVSPKQFSRVCRFGKMIDQLSTYTHETPPNWADFALGQDFYDQAHFVKEFKSFSQMTPSEFLRKKTPHKFHVPL